MNRDKTQLINNARAFYIHIIVAIFQLGVNNLTIPIIPIVFISLVYIVCGYIFLKTVERQSYLSVISVFLILAIVIFLCRSTGSVEMLMIYMMCNIVYANFLINNFPFIHISVVTVLLISAIFPSIFMWFGLLIKVYLEKQY